MVSVIEWNNSGLVCYGCCERRVRLHEGRVVITAQFEIRHTVKGVGLFIVLVNQQTYRFAEYEQALR